MRGFRGGCFLAPVSFKRIIPCLDVANGRVVKGVNFVNLVDAGDPAECAAAYCAQQADELTLLDITATSDGRATLLDVVHRCAARCTVPLTVGGGVRSADDARALLEAGADKVGVNTAAALRPDLIDEIVRACGSRRLVVAVDAKQLAPGKWEVVTHGGKTGAGRDPIAWAAEAWRRGAGEILLTSMDADGTREGYDIPLTAAVADAVEIPVIASGGAGNLDHMVEVLLRGKADAVLAASIFHFGVHTVPEAKRYFAECGIPVHRPA